MHKKIKIKTFTLPILRSRRVALAFLAVLAIAIIAALFLYSPPIGVLAAFGVVPFLGLVMPEAQFQGKVLAGVEELQRRSETYRSDIDRLMASHNELARRINTVRAAGTEPRTGVVTDSCAQWLGAFAVATGHRRRKLENLEPSVRENLVQRAGDILGRAGLTEADVPMPVAYGAEVVELVAKYGAARKWGTPFPAPTGNFKPPRLKTSPTFGLIGMSQPVTEKSPQYEYVTFTAKKWGGLIRLPSELSEDSFVALGKWIAVYCAREIAAAEDRLFFIADGTATYDSLVGVVGQAIALGKVVQLGAGKTHPLDITLGNLRTLRGQVSSAAYSNAAYYVHPTHEALFFSLNSGGDTPYVVSGTEPRFDGFPVRFVPVLPVYDSGAHASQGQILFGDLSYHWLGVVGQIRLETSVDAAFETDEILIRCLERFTTGLMADDALAVLQLAAA